MDSNSQAQITRFSDPVEPMSLSQPLRSTENPHRALVCYDVLCSIFDQLAVSEAAWYDYDPSTQDSNAWYNRREDLLCRSTLARCSRVCRAFCVPAAAVLWRDLDSLSPLISLLHNPPSSPSESQITRPPQWDIAALEHSRRVHSVHGFGKPLSPTELQSLANLSPDGVDEQLVPQLRHLRWTQPVPSGMELLRLISPSLQSLHIIFRRSSHTHTLPLPSVCEPYVRTLLKEVVARAPCLRYLRISTNGDTKESWMDPIVGFDRLTTIDVLDRIYSGVSTTPLIRSLSSLQNLQHLKIRLPTEVPSDIGLAAFPLLRTLTLDAMTAPLLVVSEFLSLIASRDLYSLVVQNCECTTAIAAKLYEVCNTIRTHFAISLRQIELSLRVVGPVSAETQPLIRAIEPLLQLHDLDDVRIEIAPQIAVVPASKHDLEAMAAAWPKATRLHLCYFPSTASPSMEDVEGFAQHCSGITDLVLPGIDASGTDHGTGSKAVIRANDAHRHRLRSLCLSDGGWNSRIPDPSRLARFLDRLFPEVEWKCPPLASEHWRETIQEVVRLRITRMLIV